MKAEAAIAVRSPGTPGPVALRGARGRRSELWRSTSARTAYLGADPAPRPAELPPRPALRGPGKVAFVSLSLAGDARRLAVFPVRRRPMVSSATGARRAGARPGPGPGAGRDCCSPLLTWSPASVPPAGFQARQCGRPGPTGPLSPAGSRPRVARGSATVASDLHASAAAEVRRGAPAQPSRPGCRLPSHPHGPAREAGLKEENR